MCEILVLIFLGRKIAAMAKDRGRQAWPWVLMMVVGWYGGAIGMAVLAGIVTAIADPAAFDNDDLNPVFILAALVGAVGGVTFTFIVVSMLPAVEDDRRYGRSRRYDDDDDRWDDRRRPARDDWDDRRRDDRDDDRRNERDDYRDRWSDR